MTAIDNLKSLVESLEPKEQRELFKRVKEYEAARQEEDLREMAKLAAIYPEYVRIYLPKGEKQLLDAALAEVNSG